jgi:glyoxylase-like metal-dependent hydrolase (beta-lactamase superfamily II)
MRAILPLLALSVVACSSESRAQDYQLIPGTFEEGRQPDGNSIILDAPEGLIVIDTGRHAPLQEKILASANASGKPIAAIINSHWHLDHTGGNQEIRAAFPNTRIIASNAAAGALTGFLADSRKGAEEYLASGMVSPEQEAEIRGDFAAMDARADLLPTDPVTSSGRRVIAGRPLDIHLAEYAATSGDVWVYDPATKTVFAGDLVVGIAPFMDTACVDGWSAALDRIDAVPFTTLVPGHGAAMGHAAFRQWKTAFRNLVDCAATKATNAECVAGWNRDAAPFIAEFAPRKADGLIEYYLKTRLRAEPAERVKYCRVPATVPAAPERD